MMVHSLGPCHPYILRSFLHGPSNNFCLRQKQWVCIQPTHVPGLVSSFGVLASKAANGCEDSGSKTLAVDERTGGWQYEGVVEKGGCKVRLDQWLSRQLPRVSRARVQSSIRHGLAFVNGLPADKVSFSVKGGDHVQCKLIEPNPSGAEPEEIALDIAYEDEHLLVINKPAYMVVHPAPGHSSGTLVNALLYHCGLPSLRTSSQKGLVGCEADQLQEDEDEGLYEDVNDKEAVSNLAHDISWSGLAPIIRPGIVHRLDKGTSGLLVVAKDDYTHDHLCNQFKARTVRRSYLGLTCGLPPLGIGRVDVPIGRDPRDRKRMATFPFASPNTRTRSAASKYRVLEILAQGGSALVEWRLETGRTHQIRVHAQHLGYPLLGDEIYGGTKGAAVAQLLQRCPSGKQGFLKHLVAQIERPCLHAQTLGFTHPWTGADHNFRCSPPKDFEDILQALRQFGKTGFETGLEHLAFFKFKEYVSPDARPEKFGDTVGPNLECQSKETFLHGLVVRMVVEHVVLFNFKDGCTDEQENYLYKGLWTFKDCFPSIMAVFRGSSHQILRQVDTDLPPLYRDNEKFNEGVDHIEVFKVKEGVPIAEVQGFLNAVADLPKHVQIDIMQLTSGTNYKPIEKFTHVVILHLPSVEALAALIEDSAYVDFSFFPSISILRGHLV